MLSWLSELIWADWIWFPEGHGWADLQDHDGKVFPKPRDLWATIPVAICFLVIRQIFERTVAIPLASLLGVSDKQRVRASQIPSWRPISAAHQSIPHSWRFTFYLLAFFAGLAVLIDKPWFYDMKLMWDGFPKMPLLPSQYWYYMIELGFYVSLLFSVASDVKRKDFKEQIIHHVATIVLISFSWLVNYIRGGTLIMLVHDASDYLMESAKMFNYAGWRKTCNFIFTMFAAMFIITRLVILPFWYKCCYITFTDHIHDMGVPLTLYPPFFGFYFFNGLMFVLQALHIFWAVLILRMVVKFLPGNDIVEDERSDKEETESEDEGDDREQREKSKNGHVQNGHASFNNNHRKTD